MEEIWAFEHSVQCPVPREFAWDYWTDVSNWTLDSDVDFVELEGAFAPGVRGVTQSKTSGRVEWQIAEVAPPGRAVIEFAAPGAVARFVWTFTQMEDGTRMTQRFSLAGEQAQNYVEAVGVGMKAGIPQGMEKLCQAMVAAKVESGL